MSNIILPQASMLSQFDENTNLIVEQEGVLKRYDINNITVLSQFDENTNLIVEQEGVLKKYDINNITELIQKAAPRNLLDNSDFRNPVNQRGQTSYDGVVYGIDRWYGRVANQTVSVRSSDVTVTATSAAYYVGLKQKIENIAGYAGKTVTLACYVYSTRGVAVGFVNASDTALNETVDNTSGSKIIICSYTIPSDATTDTVIPRLLLRTTAQGNYMRLYWAALYEGEYTIDTLPEYQPKGYGAELAECMRYFIKLAAWAQTGTGAVDYQGASANIVVPTGAVMRISPTVTGGKSNSYLRVNGHAISCASAIITAIPAGAYLIVNVAISGLGNYANHLAEFDVGDNPMLFTADL